MSKVLKVVGVIAGAVALVATGVGAFAVAGSALATTAGTVATIAGLVSGVASIGAGLLQKPPPARGSVSQVLIQADAPAPYVMGEGLFAGVVRHDCAYGPTLNKVPNPYRFIAALYCVAGPIHSITPYVDQGPVSSWYSGFLYSDTQLGTTPETNALVPQWTGAPGWGTASKLSGKAAIGWSFKFDKDGKRFASGLPAISAYGKWVKVYDPRKDSTFPGGSGLHRLGVETTYEWSENPALHAGTYAHGRYQNSKRVMGVGLPKEAINWNAVAGWANVCDLNAWTIYGVVYEPGDRWSNLRDICFAGGAEPAFSGGVLSFRYSAPKVPLDTITETDLIDESASVTAMASWRDRVNNVIPKYRSPAHNWELVPASPVTVPAYVTEDGEVKSEEIPFNFVKKADQAEQLAAYRLVDGRELQPITITCGPRMFAYRPGECLHLTLPSLSLDTDAIILRRDFDPARMTVTFTLIGETPDKHPFALGKTGTAPATPALKQSGEVRDEISDAVLLRTDDIADAYALALARGKVWTTPAMPSVAESNPGDTWIAPDGTFYDRVNDGGILLGGFAITLAGYRPRIAWTLAANQVLRDTLALADVAYTNANDAIDQLISLADDGLLSRNEKITKLVPESARLEDKWTSLSAIATSLSVSTTAASAARTAWLAFLAGLSPSWNNTAADTVVSRASFDAARDAYDAALYELDRAIKDKAATVATWAGVSGSGRPADNATVGAPTGTPVGSITAGDVSSTINSGGGVANNQVVTTAIVADSVTGAQQGYSPSTIIGAGVGSSFILVQYNVTLASAGDIIAWANVGQIFASGNRNFVINLNINYSTVNSVGGNVSQVGVPISGKMSLPAGTYVVSVTWEASDSTVSAPAGATSLIAMKRYR